ncbi:hypothetical protein PO909_032483 [Leuciscus waleckii]
MVYTESNLNSLLLFSGEFLQAAPKKKPRWTPLEIGLLTIVSLLFVIIVALILLFITQSGKSKCMRFSVLLSN